MKNISHRWTQENFSIGFVPTMGALHQGHISLLEKARKENDKVVVSIFVNPTQFNNPDDLENYPRPLEEDTKLIDAVGVDVLFMPTTIEMYPKKPFVSIHMHHLGEYGEGGCRPGHFDGVCLVITKLFNIVQPSRSYFGEKDVQQLRIVQQLCSELNFSTQIIPCPTVRESDGLAMSSRNTLLSKEERKIAPIVYNSLSHAKKLFEGGERRVDILHQDMRKIIDAEKRAKIDSIEIVDKESFAPIKNEIKEKAIITSSVFFGNVRLIDNITL